MVNQYRRPAETGVPAWRNVAPRTPYTPAIPALSPTPSPPGLHAPVAEPVAAASRHLDRRARLPYIAQRAAG